MIDAPSLTHMLALLNKQMPDVMRMVTALSYVTGLIMVFTSVMKFKAYGESRGPSSSQADLKAPLLLLIGGGALIFFPTIVHTGIQTFWAYNNPLQYKAAMVGGTRSASMKAIVAIVQVLGVIAAVRGIHLLSKAGSQGQPNLMSKGVTHIVGGILAINIYGFWVMLTNSIGISVS